MPVLWDWEEEAAPEDDQQVPEFDLEQRFRKCLTLCREQNQFEQNKDKSESYLVWNIFHREIPFRHVPHLSLLSMNKVAEENICLVDAPKSVRYCKEYYVINKVNNFEMSYCREDCLSGL